MTEAELIASLEQRGCVNVRVATRMMDACSKKGIAVEFNRAGRWYRDGVVSPPERDTSDALAALHTWAMERL